MHASDRRGAGLVRLFFVLVFVPMFLVFPYQRDINNPNEFTRVFTTMMLVEKGTFRIDEPVQMWGWVNDMARAPGLDDKLPHYTMVKAPAAAYAGVPGYFVFSKIVAPLLGKHYPTMASSTEDKLWWLRNATWSMRLVASQLPCFLFLVWFERWLRAYSNDTAIRLTAVAACGLGTNYLAYTHIFASHSQYAAAAFLAFGLIERERRRSHSDARKRSWKIAALAGWFTSLCVMLEYHALFLTLVLSLFALTVFWRPTRLVAFGLGALVNIPPVMLFHWRAYGNPLTPGHQMLETQSFAAIHNTGLWGVQWPKWETLAALGADPGFGFFGMSPFMWIALFGVLLVLVSPPGVRRHRSDARVATFWAALSAAVLFGVGAGIVNWRAGWTVGPRYLAAASPFFAFIAAISLERFAGRSDARRALARGLGGGLALASVLAIGTVGIVHDTLPETIRRPFLQFAVPMAWVGFVPHHVGEWFGWTSATLWYVTCAVLVITPIVTGLAARPERSRSRTAIRVVAFAVALVAGMVPQFSAPEDGSKLWVVYPAAAFGPSWEPAGRDRIALLRVEAERYGTRGPGPCLWLKLAELDRIAGMDAQAAKDHARAGGVTRAQCHLRRIYPLPNER
jgi:hypothetical protein